MGLTQHTHGVATIQDAVALLLMRGMIGKRGAGVCPVRGHSNVQGDRTMGIWEKVPESFLTALDTEFGITCPRAHGFDAVEAIRAMRDRHASVFMAMGGNFLSATPDTEVTTAALRTCALTVQVSTKLNRSHLVHGATGIILPSLGRTDKDIRGGAGNWCRWRIRCRWCTSPAVVSLPPVHICAARWPSCANSPSTCSVPPIPCRGRGSPTTTTASAMPSPE